LQTHTIDIVLVRRVNSIVNVCF